MRILSPKFALTALLATALVACGGGGGDGGDGGGGVTPTPSSDQQTPTPSSNQQTPTPSSNEQTPSTPSSETPTTPANAPTPNPAFTAFLTSADPVPDEGATISGTIPLVVRGTAMANVELLPSVGYEPKLLILDISQDHTKASGNLDTLRLPNGTLTVKLVAFDGQIGQQANQITVMQRTWNVNNNWAVGSPLYSTPRRADFVIPPPSVMPDARVRVLDLPYVDPKPLDDLLALGRAEVNQRVTNDWPSIAAIMYRYLPSNARLQATGPQANFEGWWNNCVNRVSGQEASCFDAMSSMSTTMKQFAP